MSNGEGAGVGAEKLVHSAGGAGEFGVVVVMDDETGAGDQAGCDEAEAGFDGIIEVAVQEGEGDLVGEVGGSESGEPGFFDDGILEAGTAEFGGDLVLGDGEGAGSEMLAGAGEVLGGFLGETSKGVVEPEARGGSRSGRGGGGAGGVGGGG